MATTTTTTRGMKTRLKLDCQECNGAVVQLPTLQGKQVVAFRETTTTPPGERTTAGTETMQAIIKDGEIITGGMIIGHIVGGIIRRHLV